MGDGENDNIVDINDDIWEELAAAMSEFNLAIPQRRLGLAS